MSAIGPEIDFPIGVPSICFSILPSIVLKCVSKQISNNFIISSVFQSVRSDKLVSLSNLFRTHSNAFGMGMLGYRATMSNDACISYSSTLRFPRNCFKS